jgi:hypothetical protein
MESDLVEYIAKYLVNEAEAVTVKSRRAGSTTIVHLNVARGDMGRVIGKNGRVANAIRSLLRVMGSNNDTKIVLEID